MKVANQTVLFLSTSTTRNYNRYRMREYKSKKESKDLFDSFSGESEGEEEGEVFQVNKKYAKEFNERKQREELARYSKDEGIDSSDSEDEEEEDEYAQLLTPQLDIQIFKAINAIRRDDKRIYDPNVKLFEDSNNSAAQLQQNDEADNARKNKKVHYKDVIRDQILEQMEIDRDGSDDEDKQRIASTSRVGAVHKLAYDEEQRHIRDSFLKSSADQDKTDDDDNDSILVMKPNNKVNTNILDPQEEEEEMLRQEIETLMEHGDNDSTFQDPRGEISDGNKFLQEYLLQRKWIDKSELFLLDDDEREEDNPNKICGDEKTDIDSGPKKTKKSSSSSAIAGTDTNGVCDQDDDESSLEELERMEEFESKYNFRFEEALAENDTSRYQIVSYARGKPIDSLRRNDDARKKKRLQREERKLAERKAKEEQLRRLKNAKKAELQEKISKIRSICGSSNNQNTLDEETLAKLMEEEFDPDKFSKIMDEAYGDDFYGEEDIAWKSDKDVKQSMAKDNEDLLLEGEYYDYDNEDLYDDGNDDEGRKDDDDVYDAEIEEDNDNYYAEEELEESSLDRQLKQKMLDELYKLDYEDIIGDMPCRFKYRRVEPNSYGLSCEEILFANDTALKQFVSLKSMNPYREIVSLFGASNGCSVMSD